MALKMPAGRKYPTPPVVRFPLMFQQWRNLTFLHWRFPVAEIARLVPPPLEVEPFDESGWVGVTPFWLSGLRPPFLPALPWLSAFPETNCRTYVRGPDGEPGIWFFSLDAQRAAAVVGARIGYGLPYAWSWMRVRRVGSRMQYESRRRWPDHVAMSRIEVEPTARAETRELETFLTARFRLYSFIAGLLTYTEVEHGPWPLYHARIIRLEQTLTRVAGLPAPNEAPMAHFSPGVAVRVARPSLVWGARQLAALSWREN